MEEKERYYSLIDNNGNFELRDYESNQDIHSLYELDDLLNQQDKRIKELEEHALNEQEWQHYCAFKHIEPQIKGCLDRENLLIKENQQLKQSQNKKTIELLEKVKIYFDDKEDNDYDESEGWIITNRSVVEYVDSLIKKLKEYKWA